MCEQCSYIHVSHTVVGVTLHVDSCDIALYMSYRLRRIIGTIVKIGGLVERRLCPVGGLTIFSGLSSLAYRQPCLIGKVEILG